MVGLGQQFNKSKYLLALVRDTVPWGESIIIKQTLIAHDDLSAFFESYGICRQKTPLLNQQLSKKATCGARFSIYQQKS